MIFKDRFYPKWKLFSSKYSEEKIVRTACFVIIFLLFPLVAKSYLSLFAGVTYAAFIIPTLISPNYKYPPTPLKHLLNPLLDLIRIIMKRSKNFLLNVYAPIARMELALFAIPNIFTMICQLTFFSSCDRMLLLEHKTSSLYTLIFYNVLTYCFSYIKELVEKENWSMSINISETSNLKHLSLTATKLVLEWSKAITFIITFVFLLLVFTLEQALDRYYPTRTYLILTGLYYISTEKLYVEMISKLLSLCDISYLDGLEQYWTPIILKSFIMFLSVLCSFILFLSEQYRYILFNIYINIYLIYKYIKILHIPKLNSEIDICKKFRYVTKQELSSWNDICPICLNNLSLNKTRITQCSHLFHSECLRKCLKLLQNNTCPMCKKVLSSRD